MSEYKIHIFPDGRMTPKDAAYYIGVSDRTLANWRPFGRGPKFTKIGGKVFYYQSEVDRWLQQDGMFQTTAQARLVKKSLQNQADIRNSLFTLELEPRK